ncbi:histone-arginine methyltransferase METTL23-like [Brevipalpus obovatus]|uniref:histone-arginine methyltransferase METTL23-like n=1 Tax=Brevipalpus obovatus TaxID=246614 RepID=UPI003D9E6A29
MQSEKGNENKLITERIISVDDESGSDCVSVRLKEMCDPDYGLFLWPSASVLARFLHHNRSEFRGKKVLEIGGGIGACGLVAALIGSSVTITDRHSLLIKSDLIQQNAQLNNIPVSMVADNPFGSVRVYPLTWGRFPSDFGELSSDGKFDYIISSDCFYDPADFEDILVSVSFFLRSNLNAIFYTSYQIRDANWNIECLLKRWNLACEQIKTDETTSSSRSSHSIIILKIIST